MRGAFVDQFWISVKRRVRDTPQPRAQLFFDWEKQVAQRATRQRASAQASPRRAARYEQLGWERAREVFSKPLDGAFA